MRSPGAALAMIWLVGLLVAGVTSQGDISAGSPAKEAVAAAAANTAASVAVSRAPVNTAFPADSKAVLAGLSLDAPPLLCPANSKVLLPPNLPDNWGTLTAAQQTQHPIMLVMHQIAAIANAPSKRAFQACVSPWGVNTATITQVFQRWTFQGARSINNAWVWAAGSNLFVTIRGQHGAAVDDALNLVPAAPLGATGNGNVHQGYLAAAQQLLIDLAPALNSVKAKAGITGLANVWLVGHSSGADLAYLVATALATGTVPGFLVSAVVALAPLRIGDTDFQTEYNSLSASSGSLRSATLHVSNDGDSANTEAAPYAFPNPGAVNYQNVGRGVVMCALANGLATFNYVDDQNSAFCLGGPQNLQAKDFVANGNHVLGNYFDTWRRAYFNDNSGSTLATNINLRAVECLACAWPTLAGGLSWTNTNTDQLLLYVPWNFPARVGGNILVTCHGDKDCSNLTAFNAATAINSGRTALYRPLATCSTQSLLNGLIPPIQACVGPILGTVLGG